MLIQMTLLSPHWQPRAAGKALASVLILRRDMRKGFYASVFSKNNPNFCDFRGRAGKAH